MTFDLRPVRFGLLFGLLAVLYGWGLGLLFGVNEDRFHQRFIADAEASRAIYLQKAGSEEGASAAIEEIDQSAWTYFLRAHLHAGGIGSIAIGASLVLSLLSVGRGPKLVASLLLGLGALGYPLFWMWAGLRAPGLGSTGAAKESLQWLAIPSAGGLFIGALITFGLVVVDLFSRRRAAAVATLVLLGPGFAAAQGSGLDTARVERLTGAKGALDEKEGVFKVSVPRTDLAITAAGVRVTPPMGLTSWAAFQKAGGHTMVMGDLVLLEDQVNPVMSAALDAGLEVTALHNHFLWDTPRVMFMHIAGMGDESVLASAVGRVLARIAGTAGGKGDSPRAEIDPARTTLDPRRIAGILGRKGASSAGVYKVVVGRPARMHGHEVGAAMGVNTWAAFAGSDEQAVVDGDFAMVEGELQAVLKALRSGGIQVVAIHHHMTGEEPRIVFLHYWGLGRTEDLARALRSALDQTRVSAP